MTSGFRSYFEDALPRLGNPEVDPLALDWDAIAIAIEYGDAEWLAAALVVAQDAVNAGVTSSPSVRAFGFLRAFGSDRFVYAVRAFRPYGPFGPGGTRPDNVREYVAIRVTVDGGPERSLVDVFDRDFVFDRYKSFPADAMAIRYLAVGAEVVVGGKAYRRTK